MRIDGAFGVGVTSAWNYVRMGRLMRTSRRQQASDYQSSIIRERQITAVACRCRSTSKSPSPPPFLTRVNLHSCCCYCYWYIPTLDSIVSPRYSRVFGTFTRERLSSSAAVHTFYCYFVTIRKGSFLQKTKQKLLTKFPRLVLHGGSAVRR